MMQEMDSDSAAATSQEPTSDLSQGYRIELEVRPGGFTVSDPQPLDDEGDEPTDTDNTVPTLAEAMKHIMAVVKAQPVGADENAMMEAGHAMGRSM